jgi:hypothetical protein
MIEALLVSIFLSSFCVRLSAIYISDIEADVLDELDGPLVSIER